jgi:hypothetical protein
MTPKFYEEMKFTENIAIRTVAGQLFYGTSSMTKINLADFGV